MSITAEVESNLQDFITVSNAIHEGMIEGINTAAKYILDLATQLAPEDSGDLKGSGEIGGSGTDITVSFGNGLPDDRAVAQEYGTIYMPAQPYLGPAVKEIDIVEEVATAIRRKLN